MYPTSQRHRGTCPMASIMGMAGVKMPEKSEASASAPSNGANGANGSSSFMKGKSLVPGQDLGSHWGNCVILPVHEQLKMALIVSGN